MAVKQNGVLGTFTPTVTPYTNLTVNATHPNNKLATGPLERFKKMIYSDSYKILISHENNEAIFLKESLNKLVY